MTQVRLWAGALVFVAGCAAHEPPRPLTGRELANVTAFTNALGYVRFFHPTEAAARVNWDAFAVRSIRAVHDAPTADSLASALTSVFAPFTSNVRFARTGAPLPTTIARPGDATHVVFWRHVGLGAPSGGVDGMQSNGLYFSERVVVPLDAIGRPVSAPVYDTPARFSSDTAVFARVLHPPAGGRTDTTPAANRFGVVVSLPPVPDPARPIVADLGGGVSMSMPVALFTNSDAVDESVRRPNASPVMERFSADDRATRLADVALTWCMVAPRR